MPDSNLARPAGAASRCAVPHPARPRAPRPERRGARPSSRV
ncbi:hypothetical protein HMPREF9005_0364, partial [Actinomyces sp. oral taxon 178 str. F0338]